LICGEHVKEALGRGWRRGLGLWDFSTKKSGGLTKIEIGYPSDL